jgi:hypothetical protein
MGVWSMKEVANGHADNEAGRLAASLAQASAAVSEPNATGAPGEAGASVSSGNSVFPPAAAGRRADRLLRKEKCAGWHTTNMYGAGAWATGAITRPGWRRFTPAGATLTPRVLANDRRSS